MRCSCCRPRKPRARARPPPDFGTVGTPLGFGIESAGGARQAELPRKASRGTAVDHDAAPVEKPLSARIFSALAGAALVALALLMFVAYRNGGRLDLHDPMTSIFGAFGFSRPVAARQALPARITESGFYLTLRGEPILFVRGTITNLSGAPTRVSLKLEVSAQGQVIATAEGPPGVSPTPEELFNAGAAPMPDLKAKDGPPPDLKNDVRAIAGRLLAAGSPALGQGESQTFVLFTADVPPSARASPEPLELRVSAQALPQAELATPPAPGLTALAPPPAKK